MIKVAIYKNDPYGEALSVLLQETEGFNVVGTYSDAKPLELNHTHTVPDVVLLDLYQQPVSKAFLNIQNIKSQNEAVKVIMLADELDRDTVVGCVRAGADGYLLRKTSFTMLRDFIIEAYSGGFPMSPTVVRQLMDAYSPAQQMPPLVNALTTRERDVLKLLVDGMTYKMIAAELCIAIDTVRSHIKNIYEKLEVNSKSEAVARALRGNYF